MFLVSVVAWTALYCPHMRRQSVFIDDFFFAARSGCTGVIPSFIMKERRDGEQRKMGNLYGKRVSNQAEEDLSKQASEALESSISLIVEKKSHRNVTELSHNDCVTALCRSRMRSLCYLV